MHAKFLAYCIGIFLAAGFADQAHGQLKVRTRPALYQNPEVVLPFRLECGDDLAGFSDTAIHVFENGKEITDFSLDFPWQCGVFSTGTAFLVDRGDSMGTGSPNGTEMARRSVRMILSISDKRGMDDVAFLASFNEGVTVENQWTSAYDAVRGKLDSLRTGGRSAIRDALSITLRGIPPTHTPCALVLVTTGLDNASHSTLDEAIGIANHNALRIYTIGVGSSRNDSVLDYLARGTGGRYFPLPDSSAIEELAASIHRYEFYYNWYPTITYLSPCSPDSIRNVEVSIAGNAPCTDTAHFTYSYTAKPGFPQEVDLAITNISAAAGAGIDVPIILMTPTTQSFCASDFLLHVDTMSVRLENVYSPLRDSWQSPGSLYPGPEGYSIRIYPAAERAYGDTVAVLRFRVLDRAADTTIILKISNWRIRGGCLQPVPHDGALQILKRPTGTEMEKPEEFVILKNYPNPFSNRTTIQFRMTSDELRMEGKSSIRNPQSAISLKVYDLLGREVLDLTDRARASAEIAVDRTQLGAPGAYIVRLNAVGGNLFAKMILVDTRREQR